MALSLSRSTRKAPFLAAAITMFSGLMAVSASAQIKVGFNVPLTGFVAADGKSALDGAKLAVTQANEAGGIGGQKIELVVYDDQASPKEAAPAVTKMLEKDQIVAGVSGSYSGSTRAAAALFQAATAASSIRRKDTNGTEIACWRCFRASANASARLPATCPAANSRCSPSGVP